MKQNKIYKRLLKINQPYNLPPDYREITKNVILGKVNHYFKNYRDCNFYAPNKPKGGGNIRLGKLSNALIEIIEDNTPDLKVTVQELIKVEIQLAEKEILKTEIGPKSIFNYLIKKKFSKDKLPADNSVEQWFRLYDRFFYENMDIMTDYFGFKFSMNLEQGNIVLQFNSTFGYHISQKEYIFDKMKDKLERGI